MCRLTLLLSLALAIAESAAAVSERAPLLEMVTTSRPFLRWTRPAYRNCACQNITNYVGHTYPYVDTPKTQYDFLGHYLMTGYDLYRWEETRMPHQEYGSAIFKEFGLDEVGGTWPNAFDYMVAGRDGYGRWGYNIIVGDALIARFSPLTLSKVNYNGTRLDISTPYLKLTGLASRQERPKDRARPGDGRGGAVVQEVQLVINGEVRPDLAPKIISHRANPPVQVGFVSAVTGVFTPLPYNVFTASSGGPGFFNETFYRERDYPLFADYLTRFDHAAGVDVGRMANIAGLEARYPARVGGQTYGASLCAPWSVSPSLGAPSESPPVAAKRTVPC